MELAEAIARRRSIRKYRPDPVPEETLRRLYEAMRRAPSGMNRQEYAFIFVTDPETRARIAAEAGHQEFLAEAPVLMVAVCPRGGAFNVAIAVDHLILAATAERLGTCWVGWFEREPMRRILGIPDEMDVPILVPIGYPAEAPEARPRKPLSELIMRDGYGQPGE